MAIKFNRSQTFATNGTVDAPSLHNLVDSLNIYQSLITDQTNVTSVSTADELLIAIAAGSSGDAPKAVTVQELFQDALTSGTYTNANISEALTYGTATGNRTVSTSATITTGTITTAVIPTLTAGTTTSTVATITNGTITTALIPTLTAGTTTGTAGIFTSGTVTTLNSTTGTIGTLNSTTGTIANLSTTLAGDLTISQGTATLATSGATAGTYGSVTAIPFITVDAKGRITSATTGTFSPADGSITPAKLSQPFTLATAVASTSGTAIDFTSIPSWVKRVSVLFNKVGISGTSNMLVQLGTSGGIQGTDYEAQASVVNTNVATLNSTSGFPIRNVEAAARISGIMTIAGMGSNLWVMSGTLTVIGGVASVQMVAGVIQLSGVLNRVRINALAAETFDGGSLNIMYEG